MDFILKGDLNVNDQHAGPIAHFLKALGDGWFSAAFSCPSFGEGDSGIGRMDFYLGGRTEAEKPFAGIILIPVQ